MAELVARNKGLVVAVAKIAAIAVAAGVAVYALGTTLAWAAGVFGVPVILEVLRY